MLCRICKSANVTRIGKVEYFCSYSCEIYDCNTCGCRFTQHFEVYELLHANASSCYGLQREIAERLKKIFDAKDLKKLREELSLNLKYKFILDALEPYPKAARVLEVGCSRGYLTSYSILAGRDITGVDIAKSAVESATANFGEYFRLISDPTIVQRAPYDVIYHIGTIGCVPDPVGLTRFLLSMLKPGGKLLFNAPNVDGCWLRGQLWIDFAPPPDVVTLYKPGFWTRTFSDEASVAEEIEYCEAEESFMIGMRKIMRRWKQPRRQAIEASLQHYKNGPQYARSVFDRVFERLGRIAASAARGTGLISYVPLQPTPYGYYLTLTKNA